MHFDVLKNLKLGLKVPLVDDLDEVAEHLGPEFVGRVGIVDHCCYVVPELID